METKHLKHYAKKLVAAARMLDMAVDADDSEAVVAAHAAVGRVRERMGPAIGWVQKAHERNQASTSSPSKESKSA